MLIAIRLIGPVFLTLVALGAVLTACAHKSPEPYYREETLDLTATVVAIDHQARLVTLRDEAGRTATVYVLPDVRNLEQIKAGDLLVVSYHAAVGAVVTSEKATVGVDEDVMLHRAAPGEKPHGAVGSSITTTVKIDSVDTSFNTITFRRDDGFVRTVAIENPKAREFIRTLKPGDLVLVTYAEAVAISVKPASGGS